jgi:hypothetical protein
MNGVLSEALRTTALGMGDCSRYIIRLITYSGHHETNF